MPFVANVIAATQLSRQQLELTRCFLELPAYKVSHTKVNWGRGTGVAQPTCRLGYRRSVSVSMSEITSVRYKH